MIYEFLKLPTYAGTYWLGGAGVGLGVHLQLKPSWLHRWLMKKALGFEWRDSVSGHVRERL